MYNQREEIRGNAVAVSQTRRINILLREVLIIYNLGRFQRSNHCRSIVSDVTVRVDLVSSEIPFLDIIPIYFSGYSIPKPVNRPQEQIDGIAWVIIKQA